MPSFDLSNVPERDQLSFQMLVCMRDIVSIARKKSLRPTYERALELFHDFSPELYNQITETLQQRNLSDEARLMIAKAASESKLREVEVTPLQILEEEVEQFNEYIDNTPNFENDTLRLLQNKLSNLQSIRKSLKPRKLTENRILIRDTSNADRKDFGAKFLGNDDFYVDYALDNSKYLRIRMLHPDKPEHTTGADLVYEQHLENSGHIRVMFLQYKIWDNGVLYLSKAQNLPAQLKRLKESLCDKGYCNGPKLPNGKQDFRFPYCSAFLRPTDKLQYSSTKLVSSGLHIPVCHVHELVVSGTERLDKKTMKGTLLNHELFEPLFNMGCLGSAWMPEKELEAFYKESQILEKDDVITFYAREIKPDIAHSYTETDL